MLLPARRCGQLSNFLAPFGAEHLGSGLPALVATNGAESYRVWVSAIDGFFQRRTVNVLPNRMFHHVTGDLHEVALAG